MPHWICDDCQSHFPKGVKECPKCNPGADWEFPKLKDKKYVMSPKLWLIKHCGHPLLVKHLKKSNMVMLKCRKCVEYYLL